jgi:hypothetical protein
MKMIKSVWLTSEPKIGTLHELVFTTLSNFRRGALRGHPHTLRFRATAGGAAARFGPPPASAIPRFARVRKLTSANLNPALAVKNLLDMQIVDRSALSIATNASLPS